MKHFLLLIFALFFTTSAHSQWSFGAYVGANSTKLSGDNPPNFLYESKIAPVLGVVVDYHVTEDTRISFQPGLSLLRPHLLYEDSDADEVFDSVTLNLNYLRLPVFLDVTSNNAKWHFMAGVDPEIAITTKGVTTSGEIDLSDQLTDVNLLLVFGLGRKIKIGKPTLNIDLRFTQSILNISDVPNDDSSLVPRIKTSGVELIVSVEIFNKTKNQ